MRPRGLPEGKELEILETVRDKVPPEVFTTPYNNPVGGNPESVRANLREAMRLLKEAGYEVRDRKLVNAKTGEPFSVEFLVRRSDLRAHRAVLQALARAARHHGRPCAPSTMRNIENRVRSLGLRHHHRRSGASRCRPATSSAILGLAGGRPPGSRNIVGIKNPAVDALIERVIFAKDRAELVAATKALDRVLLWNYYVVPQFTYRQRALRALGPFRPSRASCRNTAFRRFPTHLVVGRRARPPRSASDLEAVARMAQLTRRHVLVLGVGALSAAALRAAPRARPRRDRDARHLGVRRPEISGRLPAFRLRQSGRAEGRDVFADRPSARAFNQNFLTFNSLNAYILKGDGAQGMELTFATLMARAGDEPDAMYGLAARVGADFARQARPIASRCGPRRAFTTAPS